MNRNYRLEEEHKIALEVIESDRRTKAQFDLRKKNHQMERIVATLVFGIIVAIIVFIILQPAQHKNELDRSKQSQPTQEQVGK